MGNYAQIRHEYFCNIKQLTYEFKYEEQGNSGITINLSTDFARPSYIKVPELLATLAMQFVLNGVATTYAGAGSINEVTAIWWNGEYPTAKIPAFFTTLGKAPWIILIMLLCVVFMHIFLKYTKYGRYFY